MRQVAAGRSVGFGATTPPAEIEAGTLDALRSSVQLLQFTWRLAAMLEDLLTVAPEERRAPLREQLGLLQTRVLRTFEDGDRKRAMMPDQRGVGSGRDAILHPLR